MSKTPAAKDLPVNIVGGSSFGRYNEISSEKTYNMFVSDNWLINFAGYQRVLQPIPGLGSGRGIFTSIRGNFLLIVVNNDVYRLDGPTLTQTFIGNITTNVGEVFIDENLNNQICIVDGVNAYIYNHSLAPNLTVQVLAGTLVPNYVTYHNTFFLFGNGVRSGNGAAWYAYSYATATTITQTTQQALQTKPDFAIAVLRIPAQGANVLVFGTSVCEIHTQVGGQLNYRRNNTISVDYGCISVSTIASSDKYVVWIGVNEENSPVLMVYTGQGAERISTDGIDYLLDTIQFPSQSTASFVRVDGHLIYQFTFYNPVDNLTLMYDFNTQKFFHLSDHHLNYHPARNYAYFNQTTYFVNLNNVNIYELSTNITNINENIAPANDPTLIFDIQRIRICDTLRQDNAERFRSNVLNMTLEQGQDQRATGISLSGGIISLVTEPGFFPPYTQIITENGQLVVSQSSFFGNNSFVIPYQPRVDLTLSYDGGITWSATVSRAMNQSAFRKNKMTWNKLGSCNAITPKFRFWGLDRFVVYDAVMEVK